MYLKKIFSLLLILFTVVFVIIIKQQNNNQPPKILIGAAASLKPVLEEFNQKYPQNVDYNFASSGILQQQIEQGASIDIFISASSQQMDILEEKNLLLPDTRKDLLINKLVLITTKENPLSLTNFNDLLKPEIKLIAVGEMRSVPAGKYAQETFKNLGILDSLQSKFIFGNNVRETLTHVKKGNADGTFEQIDSLLLDSARVEGASEIAIFYYISLPLAFRGILAGTILSFSRVLGEFGATLMVAGNIPNKTQTIPMAIYFAVQAGEFQEAWFWVTILLFISFLTIFIINNLSQELGIRN
ncbi:molybdate ABC transporter substrate-binding protein [Geminocystis sp. CENA526]|uniref:molybdate ABC transporter substrate-binding protein n=1 Tax=Geminocystis sp. CENA526 TaxID=1355871 RepID=UPI003D6E5155